MQYVCMNKMTEILPSGGQLKISQKLCDKCRQMARGDPACGMKEVTPACSLYEEREVDAEECVDRDGGYQLM